MWISLPPSPPFVCGSCDVPKSFSRGCGGFLRKGKWSPLLLLLLFVLLLLPHSFNICILLPRRRGRVKELSRIFLFFLKHECFGCVECGVLAMWIRFYTRSQTESSSDQRPPPLGPHRAERLWNGGDERIQEEILQLPFLWSWKSVPPPSPSSLQSQSWQKPKPEKH